VEANMGAIVGEKHDTICGETKVDATTDA